MCACEALAVHEAAERVDTIGGRRLLTHRTQDAPSLKLLRAYGAAVVEVEIRLTLEDLAPPTPCPCPYPLGGLVPPQRDRSAAHIALQAPLVPHAAERPQPVAHGLTTASTCLGSALLVML